MNLPPDPSAPADSPRLGALLLLVLICWIAFFQGLGSLGLMDKTEALFVEVARGMADSGDWITPRWNGETFFDYPVWGYWMVALSFRLFGPYEWAARVPAALSATLTVLALFALLLRLAPPGERERRVVARALLGSTVLALSPGWVGWGRSSVTDMFLSSAIGLALFCFLLAHFAAEGSGERALGHAGMAVFAGIAVLAKGPVGLLLPGLVIVIYLLLRGRLLITLRQTPWLPMAALFLGVAVPWYALATKVNGGEFLARFLGFSNLERFTSVIYDHPGPPWFYLPWVLILLLPWSLFLPVAVARILPRGRAGWTAWRQRPPEPSDLPLFALVWLVVVVVFFSSAATKLPGYILPAVPGGALLVGLFFRPFPPAVAGVAGIPPAGAGIRITGWVNALLLALMAGAAAVAPRLAGGDPSHPGFAEAVAASGLPTTLALVLAAAAVAVAGLLATGGPKGLGRLWGPNAAAMLAVLAVVAPGVGVLIDRERQQPVRDLARLAGQQARGDEPLLVVGYKRYSVLYYSGRPVLFVSGPDRARRALDERPGSPPSTLLLLGSDAELKDFGLGEEQGSTLARRGSHRLVRLPAASLPEEDER
ncbi:glycosyltransferase family 39 protein [Cyanobium sp. FGCU-52]|nr:glycosyltransferase family 39 protein [Cyanobium sp. FGCU52]